MSESSCESYMKKQTKFALPNIKIHHKVVVIQINTVFSKNSALSLTISQFSILVLISFSLLLLDTKVQVSFSGCQYSMHIVTHHCWKINTFNDSIVRGRPEVLSLVLTLPCALLPLANFNLYLFPIIKI